jgi:hypothetical protein
LRERERERERERDGCYMISKISFFCCYPNKKGRENQLKIQYIYIYGGGKYCTSIWHEREAIFMKHPEISQERNVHLKRENKGSMASTSMQLNKKLIFRF